jgi:hypothetical protein
MSTSLAIGAVTAVLRSLILDGVNNHHLHDVLGGDPAVSALPPDRIPTGQGTPDRINLFLLQATENSALRNADLPSRNGNGGRLTNPALALDLHYLVTAYGVSDFHAEVLLGLAMFILHETPVLTREAIGAMLDLLTASNLTTALKASRLASQFEQLRIIPRVLSVEEMSKIWTALQTQYRPTAAYHVSVVLIRAEQPALSPLPVLSRGRPLPSPAPHAFDEGVFVSPGLTPPVPTLLRLEMPQAIAIRMGETLTMDGHHLAGTQVRARFRLLRDHTDLDLSAAGGGNAAGFNVQMPMDPPGGPVPASSPLNPANWRAGVYTVNGVLVQSGVERTTNRLPLVLAPRLDSITPNVVAGRVVSVEVTCSPPIQPEQQVVLVVRDRELIHSTPIAAPTGTLVFDVPAAADALPSGTWPVRLRVDGIESLVADRAVEPPIYNPTQLVVIP